MTQRRKTEIIIIIIIELSFTCGACHRWIMYWCFACNLALCASAVSLVSFNRSTAAVPVAQTEVQATGTAAVPRVTGTSDTAAVSLGSANYFVLFCTKVLYQFVPGILHDRIDEGCYIVTK